MYFSVYFATKKLVCDSTQSLSRVNLANKFIRRHRLFFLLCSSLPLEQLQVAGEEILMKRQIRIIE